MLVSISTTTRPAPDLLTLLGLDPKSTRSVDLGFGLAHLFCPDLRHDRCEVALAVEWAPQSWFQKRIRTQLAPKHFEAEANDRPFAGVSALSLALSMLFDNTLNRICPARPELVDHALHLEIEFPAVRAEIHGKSWSDLLAPLGFEVELRPLLSRPDALYHSLRLKTHQPLGEALRSIVYLAPVMDPGPWYGMTPVDSVSAVENWIRQLKTPAPLDPSIQSWILARWKQILKPIEMITHLDRLNISCQQWQLSQLPEISRKHDPAATEINAPVVSKKGGDSGKQILEWLDTLRPEPDPVENSSLIQKLHDPALIVISGGDHDTRQAVTERLFREEERMFVDDLYQWIPKDNPVGDGQIDSDLEEVFLSIVRLRLKRNRMTVIDIEGRSRDFRNELVRLGKRYHLPPVWIVLCPGGTPPAENFERKCRQEGFREVWFADSEQPRKLEVVRRKSPTLFLNWKGPFDIIGDVHGCFEELLNLLKLLGYSWEGDPWKPEAGLKLKITPQRFPVFVGDLVDRGPYPKETLKLVMHLCRTGQAGAVPGNHDEKIARALSGAQFRKRDEDFIRTLESALEDGNDFAEAVSAWIHSLPSHMALDEGKLVVAHAGSKRSHQGRNSNSIREFCLYGATTGRKDEHGLPERLNWAAEYDGPAWVIYGHTPVSAPRWENRTVNIDTGCAYGGYLTGLRYPEMETVSEPARKEYAVSKRRLPLNHVLRRKVAAPLEGRGPSEENNDRSLKSAGSWGEWKYRTWEDFVRLEEVDAGRRGVIALRGEKVRAAIDWLKENHWSEEVEGYVPPSVVAAEANSSSSELECPSSVFRYLKNNRSRMAVCSSWSPGPTSILKLKRDSATGAKRGSVLARLEKALGSSGFWERTSASQALFEMVVHDRSGRGRHNPSEKKFQDWVGESQALAEVGMFDTRAVLERINRAMEHGNDLLALAARYQKTRERLAQFSHWVDSFLHIDSDDHSSTCIHQLRLLATDQDVVLELDHDRQEFLLGYDSLRKVDPKLFVERRVYRVLLEDSVAMEQTIEKWKQETSSGVWGWQIYPFEGAPAGKRGWIQPAIKCRGLEALQRIYGLDFIQDESFETNRRRSIAARRTQAAREWALALEWLNRWKNGEPVWRLHECLVGILAVKAEPTDPRL